MRTTIRGVVAVLLLASGLLLMPGAPGAAAATTYVCSASGSLERIAPPPGGSVRWEITANGTCTSGEEEFAVQVLGGDWGYMRPFKPDYACGTVQRATETPGTQSLSIYRDGTYWTGQFWLFGQSDREYEVKGTYLGRPTGTIGAGVALHHLFMQCPGEPAATFSWTFSA